MSRLVNQISQLTDMVKQVLKAAFTTRPDASFDESNEEPGKI